MNVGSHILVAARISDDVDQWLGAALPDFAAMGRFHLCVPPAAWPDARDQPIRAGIALHHRTDEAFHRHPWFTERVQIIRHRLEAQGIARGPSRAIAHVGPEMLLDGALLGGHQPLIDATFGALDHHRRSLADWTRSSTVGHPTVDRAVDWTMHLERLVNYGLPSDYSDPVAVAHRLLRILAGRSRLGFQANQLGIVIAELEAQYPTIASEAADFFEIIVRASSPEHPA